MSALLSELSLDYEILADDPIEKGIHFGQSVLTHMVSTMDNAVSYSASKAAAIFHHPKVDDRLPIGEPITLATRPVSPRGSLEDVQVAPRINSIDFQRRKVVNAGLRPIKPRGSVDYRPRSYASRNSFMVGGN